MPYCPACRSEYRPGFGQCTDCGAELVARLPPAPPATGTPVQEVEVATFPTWLAGQLAVEQLKNEGIPSFLVAVGAGRGQPGTEQLWPHALRVRAQDAPRVRDLLRLPDSTPAHTTQLDGSSREPAFTSIPLRPLMVALLILTAASFLAGRVCGGPV